MMIPEEEIEMLRKMPKLRILLRWAGGQILEDRPARTQDDAERNKADKAEYLLKLGCWATPNSRPETGRE